jgi:carbamoyl-phosphate synthase small subunit
MNPLLRPADLAPPALLVLEDGTAFRGTSFGAPGTTFGEAVFNTGMAGYQEILTDPSYRGQIVTMTVPHVGNYGMSPQDMESDRFQVEGFVVKEAVRRPSNWRAQGDLRTALRDAGVVAVEGIDTRRLTRHIREEGAMRCGLSTEIDDVEELHRRVLESPSMEGRDLASEAGTAEPYHAAAVGEPRYRVVAVDFGMKRSMVEKMTLRGVDLQVVPGTAATAETILGHEPDGVFISNGPGDPAAVSYGVDTLRQLLGQVPVFGICLGSQLMGQALGAETYKLRFGHRGVNQPVLRRSDRTVEITSHNHGFSVDADSLGERIDAETYRTADHGVVEVSHRNLNDDTCEGIVCRDIAAFSVQYHPEAAPGPHDAEYLFQRFAQMMEA